LVLHCLQELVDRGFAPKEEWSIFLSKVEQSAIRTNGGTNGIQVSLDICPGWFPAGGFGQNYYPQVERLGSQIHPSQLTKKA
jgi:hypothetical protein